MLESIGLSLISTMISFLFEHNILKQSTIDIEGAPYWYEQRENNNRVYISTYIDGGLDSVEKCKNKVVTKITLKIEDAYKVTIKKEFSKLHTRKEIMLVQKMKNDINLSDFTKRNIVFQNIKYDEDAKRTFVRGYLNIDLLKEYQTKRMIEIKKQVLDYQFDDMLEELEKEAS